MHVFRFMRIILPALIGNILEWYEFSIYGYFAVEIAHQFFGEKNPTTSLIEVFSVLAIGFLMRPIGALVFGYIADRKGRKKALPLSIILMALATTCIGFIPTHAQIGIWAPILLVFFRAIQGFAVSGEYSSAITYIIEQTPESKRGFFGSLTLFGGYVGILLGSSVATLITYLTKNTPYFESAWRGAFILGILLGLIGYYMRKKAPETPEFLEAKKHLASNPIKLLLTKNLKSLLLGIGIVLLPAASTWMVMAYFPTYTTTYGHVAMTQTLLLETCTLLLIVSIVPLYGYLSDKFGRFPFLIISQVLLFCFSRFLFPSLLSSSLFYVFLAQAMLAVFYVMSEAILPSLLAQLFPVQQRCTGIALCINIANGLFGGTAPLIATFLIKQTGNLFSPSWYLIAVALISFLSTYFVYKTQKYRHAA